MKTTAGELRMATNAGLVLVGKDKFGAPKYHGTRSAWATYNRITHFNNTK